MKKTPKEFSEAKLSKAEELDNLGLLGFSLVLFSF